MSRHAPQPYRDRRERGNIVLVGMPGVGKSSVGVILAKAAGRFFLDTDLLIQMREGRSLQQLIDERGASGFRALEERYVRQLDCDQHVIATGGSVVYGERAMHHLRWLGQVIHLELPLPQLAQRLSNLAVRGVVMDPGQSLHELYEERLPLYHKRAHQSLCVSRLSPDQIVDRLLTLIAEV